MSDQRRLKSMDSNGEGEKPQNKYDYFHFNNMCKSKNKSKKSNQPKSQQD